MAIGFAYIFIAHEIIIDTLKIYKHCAMLERIVYISILFVAAKSINTHLSFNSCVVWRIFLAFYGFVVSNFVIV